MSEDWSTENCRKATHKYNDQASAAVSLCLIWHRNSINILSRQLERQ